MKIARILLGAALLAGFFFTATRTLAGPVDEVNAKKTPAVTPGAKATEQAEERAARQPGNSQGGNPHGKPENYRGALAAVDPGSLTIDLKDGGSVTVALIAETRIKIPTLKDAGPDSLQAGMNVVVQARRADDDTLTARSVLVVPGKPERTHRVGIVTEYLAGESITIEATDGETYTFLLADPLKILPEDRAGDLAAGSYVTIIAPRDVSTLDRAALGIVIHPAAP